MQKSENLGMQTFDRALFKLVEAGRISEDEAMKNADSPNNLRLNLSLSGKQAEVKKTPASLSLLEKEEDEEEEVNGNPGLQTTSA
jgi:twitching motility protein PilU